VFRVHATTGPGLDGGGLDGGGLDGGGLDGGGLPDGSGRIALPPWSFAWLAGR
jgi:hypothetical protein